MPKPVRVKKPRRANSLSWVSMFRVFDVQENGEFVAAPVAWWLAGDDGGDPLAAGGRPGPAGCAAVAVDPAGLEVDGRGADGDVDRGDGGGMGRAAVVAVEVPGGGAFDLAGAVSGAAGGQQRGQDGAADGAGRSAGPSWRSWPLRSSTGCSRSSMSRPTPEHAAASCSICAGKTLTSTARRSPSAGRRP